MNSVTPSDSLHIAFGIDAGFVRPMGVAATSVIVNNPHLDLTFHVFAPPLSQRDVSKLGALRDRPGVHVHLHTIDAEELSSTYGSGRRPSYCTWAAYIRILVPSRLRQVTNRVLYMDSDVLCLADLSSIRSYEFGGATVLAVRDKQAARSSLRLRESGFAVDDYFNSGVLYVDIDSWIANDIERRSLGLLLDQRMHVGDQDALNVVLNNLVHFIGNDWNHLHKLTKIDERAPESIPVGVRLLHFAGKIKPWKAWNSGPSRELFLRYQAMSPWADVPLDDTYSPVEAPYYLKHQSRRASAEGRHLSAAYYVSRAVVRRLTHAGVLAPVRRLLNAAVNRWAGGRRDRS